MGYNPDHDRVDDVDVLAEFVGAHPLATLITHDGVTPQADLVPLLAVDDAETPSGKALVGHVARANPLWEDGKHVGTSLATFGGGEHYISPTWYPSKAEHHRTVPTWNYAVVHAWGELEIHDDPRWVRAACARLTTHLESGREEPWRMGMAPPDYVDELVADIVGLRIPVTRMTGKFKVSAHKSDADRLGARDGVAGELRGANAAELAALMTDPPQQR